MTDAEIKKALECHANKDLATCKECPLLNIEDCAYKLSGNALDLINRQRAENKAFGEIMKKQDDEISELRKELLKRQNLEEFFLKERKQFDKKMLKQVKRERAEAIKEFAERLKANKFKHRNFGELVFVEDIDSFVKEMVGDAE